MNKGQQITCKNCSNTFSGKYCYQCGEKVIDPTDRSLKNIFILLSDALFSFDNKLIRSLKVFLLKPGLLTHYYSYGPRKRYLSPLSLFIILSVIYFLFPLFQTFNSTLITHMNYGFYSEGAARRVMEFTGGDDQQFKEYMLAFNESTANIGKIAIFIFVVVLTIPLSILNYSKKYYVADHTMVSFEVNAFLILLNTIILPVIVIIGRILGLKDINGDSVMGSFILIFTVAFLSMLHFRYYKNKWWVSLLKSGVLMLVLFYTLQLYRCIVFYLTHWHIT